MRSPFLAARLVGRHVDLDAMAAHADLDLEAADGAVAALGDDAAGDAARPRRRARRRRADGRPACAVRRAAPAASSSGAVVEEEPAGLDGTGSALDLADEAGDEGRGRAVVDLVGRADLLDACRWLRTTMRSASSIASSWSWVTKTVVWPVWSWISRSQRRSSRRTLASSAPNGSSRSRMRGSMASARASATRWRWPPESCVGIALLEAGELDEVEELQHARRGSRPCAGGRPRGPHGRGRRRCCRRPSCGGRARSAGRRSRRGAPARRGASASSPPKSDAAGGREARARRGCAAASSCPSRTGRAARPARPTRSRARRRGAPACRRRP